MKKILVAIPCVTGAEHVKECIESVINKPDVDVLLLSNGAVPEVKDLIKSYENRNNIICAYNAKNYYVNPAWNQFLNLFLSNDAYSHLIILNSDVIMQKQWHQVVKNIWESYGEDYSLIPVITNDKSLCNKEVTVEANLGQTVTEGTAGIFITLSKKQARMVYPIPEAIKVWFGDNYIYNIIRSFYHTIIPTNLICYHSWSQTVQKVEGVHQIIEEDKKQWAETVSHLCQAKINQLKTNTN